MFCSIKGQEKETSRNSDDGKENLMRLFEGRVEVRKGERKERKCILQECLKGQTYLVSQVGTLKTIFYEPVLNLASIILTHI